MKKILIMAALSIFSSVQAITVINRDGTVYQSPPTPQVHYHQYNYSEPTPVLGGNTAGAKYYRGEISQEQYLNSIGVPQNQTYQVQYQGNGRYQVRKGY